MSGGNGGSPTGAIDVHAHPGGALQGHGCRFTSRGQAIVNHWSCEYLPDWAMQDVIDLRVAAIDLDWFYE